MSANINFDVQVEITRRSHNIIIIIKYAQIAWVMSLCRCASCKTCYRYSRRHSFKLAYHIQTNGFCEQNNGFSCYFRFVYCWFTDGQVYLFDFPNYNKRLLYRTFVVKYSEYNIDIPILLGVIISSSQASSVGGFLLKN